MLSSLIAIHFTWLLGFTAPLVDAEDTARVPDTIQFNAHIRPIFNEHCVACHGGVKQAGEVSFVYRDKVLPPDGWIVEPGDPDASVLIERVTSTDPDTVMPPADHGDPLSKHDVALLSKWIQQGAPWESHWAYAAPQPQPLPEVKRGDWSRQPLDRFVLARLEHEGITPAPDEGPRRWYRRVCLDLTGLPPSPEALSAFIEDFVTNGESAYPRAVDPLFQSKHFGERWASVWLDQVRYADSKGLGIDGRRNAWKYRDWVISAFNRDLPFDQFTIKQIAGDLLPLGGLDDLVATAVHRMTQSNEEGGTDDEEFRIGAVLDRVSTTWQTWQGITFGCVQCHSHPYAPFEHEEFYQFAAFFNNTADCDLDEDWPVAQVPIAEEDYEQAEQLDDAIERLQQQAWEREYALLSDESTWKPLQNLSAKSNNATQIVVEQKPQHDEFHTVDTVSRNTDITVEAPLPMGCDSLTAIRFTGLPLDPDKAIADAELGFSLSHVTAELLDSEGKSTPLLIERLLIDEPNPLTDPQESLNEKSGRGFATYTQIHFPRQAALVLKEPMDVPDGARLRLVLKHRVFLLASFSLITRRAHFAVSSDERYIEMASGEEMQGLRGRIAELQSKRKAIRSTSLPILRERPDHLKRPTHVFVRGLFLDKDKQVSAGVPASLPALSDDVPKDRLALANWLVSDENPLTARVAVNRFWARLFGTGLVATEEDFGSSGESPSHPQLLDHLAVRFQTDLGWSVKKLLRELVLSRTYRQSSRVRPELAERDSENRLLARGPRHRLPAEMVRDQALAVSGLLSEDLYGPPVHPPIPDGVWRPFASWDKWNTPSNDDPNRYRRSIYTYTKRSIPYPMFAAFDAPSREFCTPRRLRSNTPLQALMTLNDETFALCADGLAKRMAGAADSPRDQLAHGFLLTTSRPARDAELDALIALYEQPAETDPQAGLRQVATVLLNLDEVLTK